MKIRDSNEERIVTNYENEEKMMILIFAQWCINQDLDPEQLYGKAYPNQVSNLLLKEALELTVSKAESSYISEQTILDLFSFYGNDDLGFVVSEELEKKKKRKE